MKNLRTFNDFINENQNIEKVEEGQYIDNMNKDQLKAYRDAISKIRIPDGDPAKGDIVDYPDMMKFLEAHENYNKLPIGKKKYVQRAVGWAIQFRWMEER